MRGTVGPVVLPTKCLYISKMAFIFTLLQGLETARRWVKGQNNLLLLDRSRGGQAIEGHSGKRVRIICMNMNKVRSNWEVNSSIKENGHVNSHFASEAFHLFRRGINCRQPSRGMLYFQSMIRIADSMQLITTLNYECRHVAFKMNQAIDKIYH